MRGRALLRVAAARLASVGAGAGADASRASALTALARLPFGTSASSSPRAFALSTARGPSAPSLLPRSARASLARAPNARPHSPRGLSSTPKRLVSASNARPASPPGAPGSAPATSTPPPAPLAPDAMPRFPSLTSVPGLLRGADYFGTAVFAVTGSLAAAKTGMDVLGCTIVGTITAVGGGTIRDVLLGAGRRAFWMEEIEYLWICVASAAGAFALAPHLERAVGFRVDHELVDWADAIGVGAFCVIGAMNGIRANVPCAAIVACGMFTATFGGVVRDVLIDRPVRILHSYTDVYATTALSGATAYVLARHAGAPTSGRILAGVVTAVAMRKFAWTHDLRLPTYAGPEEGAEEEEGGSGDGNARRLPRVPGGARAARAKGDEGGGIRPPIAEVVDAIANALGVGVSPRGGEGAKKSER